MRGGVLALVAAVWSEAASANVAWDWHPGDPIGEPSATPPLPAVERESLLIDLRPVAEGRAARVIASYRFHADEALPELRLAFVSPAVTGGAVLLDGVPVPSSPLDAPELPAEWRAPVEVPGVDGERLRFEADPSQVRVLVFTIAVSPGAHVLTVEASVRPGEHHGRRSPYREYLLAYLLAPARQWAAFGELELTVELPSGWLHAASPHLDRAGDRLFGRWAGLPGDWIAISVRPPGEATFPVTAAPWFGAGLGAVLAWLVGFWWGRRAGRRGERAWKRWWKAIGLAYLASIVVMATTAAAAVGGSALLDERHRSAGWGTAYLYDSIFTGAAGLAAALIGFFAVFVLAHRAASRSAGVVLEEARREGKT